MGKAIRLVLAGAVVAALFAAAPAATASTDVVRRGTCSAGSHWRLELSRGGGRIEVDFKVFEGVVGHTWRVVERHNGTVFFRGRRTTHDAAGYIEVDRYVPNLAGTDRIRAWAMSLSTGEVCLGVASI